MYVCMYVWMYVWIYACSYLCTIWMEVVTHDDMLGANTRRCQQTRVIIYKPLEW